MELFKQTGPIQYGNGAIIRGNRMHKIYNFPYKSFNRQFLLYKLAHLNKDMVFERQIDNIVVRGSFDDVSVIYKDGSQYVSFIEVKTTGKSRLWDPELRSALRQLQLYVWIMGPIIEKLGYKLAEQHYVEVYSQKTGALLKRIKVPSIEATLTEEWIRMVVSSFQGLTKVSVPPHFVCKLCPKNVKEMCDWKS